LAEHFNFSVFWTRVIAIVFLLLTGFWPAIGIYLIAALLMKPAPVIPIKTEAEQEFYDSYANSRHLAARRIKRRYENLERRIRRMEHIVTTREFDWEEKLSK
jgi:phage shock protein C